MEKGYINKKIRKIPAGVFNSDAGSSNKRSHFRKDGTEKVSYKSRFEANIVAKKLVKKLGPSIAVYRCLYCGKYHIGNN